jgi:hypothetical protein
MSVAANPAASKIQKRLPVMLAKMAAAVFSPKRSSTLYSLPIWYPSLLELELGNYFLEFLKKFKLKIKFEFKKKI